MPSYYQLSLIESRPPANVCILLLSYILIFVPATLSLT